MHRQLFLRSELSYLNDFTATEHRDADAPIHQNYVAGEGGVLFYNRQSWFVIVSAGCFTFETGTPVRGKRKLLTPTMESTAAAGSCL